MPTLAPKHYHAAPVSGPLAAPQGLPAVVPPVVLAQLVLPVLPSAQAGTRVKHYGARKPQVESWQFKEWFGASRIVGDQGEPLRVFHGTTAPEDFSVFGLGEFLPNEQDSDFQRFGSGHDPTTYLGSHFAKEFGVANAFAKGLYGERVGTQSTGRVYPVFLKLENPYETTETAMRTLMMEGNYNNASVDWAMDEECGEHGLDQQQAEERYESDPAFRAIINTAALDWEEAGEEFHPDLATDMARLFRDRLVAEGYDGIIYQNEGEGGTSYVIWEANRAKSALGNSGDFSSDSHDLRA